MSRTTTSSIRPGEADFLSVIHKATSKSSDEWLLLQDAVIQTDLQFNITGWNPTAELLHGLPGAMGKNLFQLVSLDFLNSSLEEFKNSLKTNRCWNGEVIFKRHDGQQIHFRCTANYIINEKGEPFAVMIISHNISGTQNHERELAEKEKEYKTLVNTLFDGVLMIKTDGKIKACNKRAAQILGLTEDEMLGKVIASPSWKVVKENGNEFPQSEFPAIVSLQTGFSQRNVVMGVEQPDGTKVWLLVNSQALFHPDDVHPYAAVVSFSDITHKLRSEEALRKSNERFYYAGKVISDAIWDIDLVTNEVYRSEAICNFSGYTREQIRPDLDWWIDKVHSEDKERVRKKMTDAINSGGTTWNDEYRFQCATGNYKYLFDSGIILYKGGKATRIIGAIQDLTERKELEARLLHEEIQKQKQINQATIAAQEQERNNISRELHDNVNQLLMSSKLYISTAQLTPDQSKELLSKAVEYQSMAVEEIRKLSKSLSSSFIKTVGLKESIKDVVYNMQMLEKLDVQFSFESCLEEKLSNEQKLMLFRVIQEQTNNIIKHAAARKVKILINEADGLVSLVITDDGKGFDTNEKGKGIGLVNIFSRADAYNGEVNIVSSTGKGCTLDLKFPLQG
jgi:PAS domain S-box-containing protein